MRVLLDINVILDAMLQRPPWHKEADAILQAAALGQVTCASTTLSLATIFYVGRRVVGTAAARGAVRKYVAAFAILPIDKQTLLDADIALFEPSLGSYQFEYGQEYSGKPILSHHHSFATKKSLEHWHAEMIAAVDAGH